MIIAFGISLFLLAWCCFAIINVSSRKVAPPREVQNMSLREALKNFWSVWTWDLSKRLREAEKGQERALPQESEIIIIEEAPRSFEWSVSNESRLGEIIPFTEIIESENKFLS